MNLGRPSGDDTLAVDANRARLQAALGVPPIYLSQVHGIASVTLDGVAPTIENVKSGSYKISRGLFSNTKGDPTGLTKKFIDYLFSPEGQKIVVDEGFIAVK